MVDPINGVDIPLTRCAAFASCGLLSRIAGARHAIADRDATGIWLGCHQGSYSPDPGNTASGAQFLPFDLDSFLDGSGTNGTPFPTDAATAFVTSQQASFHALNNMIAAIAQSANPPLPAITQLIQPPFWYSSTTASTPFAFNQGAAQLPGTPFIGHEPLYDSVVKVVCRTCHIATSPGSGLQWNAFSQMGGSNASFIQSFACGPSPPPPMSHSEVSWLRFWQQSLATTLAGELSLNSCPAPP